LGFRPPTSGGTNAGISGAANAGTSSGSSSSAAQQAVAQQAVAQQAAAESAAIQRSAPKIRGAMWWREILLSSFAASLATGILLLLFLRPYVRDLSAEIAQSARNNYSGYNGYGGNTGAPPTASNFSATPAGANPNASTAGRDTVHIVREIIHVYHGSSPRRAATLPSFASSSNNMLQAPKAADNNAQIEAQQYAATEEADLTMRSLRRSLTEIAEEATHLRVEMAALRRQTTANDDVSDDGSAATSNATSNTTVSAKSSPDSNPDSNIESSAESTESNTRKISAPESSERAWYSNLSLTVRGVRSRSLPQATVASNAERFPFPNVAASVLYKISEREEIGVEAGQEAYAQRFRSINADGVPFLIDQNPTLSWAGIAYRYTLFPESMLSPFAHGVLGVADVGLTGRLLLGLRFQPDARTQFILGAESSALMYGHQGVWYATPNIGLTYGISIRF
jgi:hypothetical protein